MIEYLTFALRATGTNQVATLCAQSLRRDPLIRLLYIRQTRL